MSYPRTLSPFALVLSLVACEPVDPIIDGGPAPVDGLWEMEIIAVDSHGRCGMTEDDDLLGLTMEMQLNTRDEHGIRFDLEGLMLKGTIDSGWIHAEGGLVSSTTVTVAVEDEGDFDDETGEDDVDHSGASSAGSDGRLSKPGSDYSRPPSDSEGIQATIEAWTLSKNSMEGALTIQYDLTEVQCVLILEFEAAHMGQRDRTEPEPIAVGQPEPADPVDDEEAVDPDED